MPDDDLVLVEVEDAVAVVTLHRPEARNALNGALMEQLDAALRRCGARDDLAAVVLTGADPAFCAGLDLGELAARADRGDVDLFPPLPIPRIPQPVIGAVNGAAVTGGLEIALACDLLVASERARFADTHARVAILPGWGLSVRLPAAVGLRRAKEMSATGNFVDAETALTWGLVNHVVPHDELVPFARALAVDMTSVDRTTLRSLMSIYDDGTDIVDGARHDLEQERYRRWRAATAASGTGSGIASNRAAIVERGRAQKG